MVIYRTLYNIVFEASPLASISATVADPHLSKMFAKLAVVNDIILDNLMIRCIIL